MRLVREEIFGPVLAVMEFDSYESAWRSPTTRRFGLTASVYTRDLRTAHSFARDVEAGFVWVNDSGRHFLGAPFGGYKDSGVGREEDTEELCSYTQVKNMNICVRVRPGLSIDPPMPESESRELHVGVEIRVRSPTSS